MATIKGHGPTRGCFKGAADGGKIWWVAPTYPVANEIIWPDLKKSLRRAWIDKSEQEHTIILPGGGSISVKSADKPDGLRGAGLDGLVFDEAAFAKDVWKEQLRPALSDRQGWAMFLTTPNGPNWFKALFDAASRRTGWERWQRPTSDNPLIPQSELDEALDDIGPRSFSQEYDAQFTETKDAEFPGDYFPDSIWFDEWPHHSEIVCRVTTLDPSLGKTDRSDYSALVDLAKDIHGNYWIDADLARRPSSQIVQDALRRCRQFEPIAFGCEINQFQELLRQQIEDAARAQGYDLWCCGINNTMKKITRIRTLTPYLSKGRFRFKAGSKGAAILVGQLQSFPVDRHDDGPDALEMAVRLCEQLLAGAVIEEPEIEERVVL